MNTQINKLSFERTKFFQRPTGRDVYFGLRLTLTRTFESVRDVHEFIQDEYYDNHGGSGNFWIMPESFKSQITENFTDRITVDQSEAVQFNKDNTVVDILLRISDYEDINDELFYIDAELKGFIEEGFASQYEQFWMF